MKNLIAVFSLVGIMFLAFSVNSNVITKSSFSKEVEFKIDDTIVSNTGCTQAKTECQKKCASTDTTKACCKKDAKFVCSKCDGTKCDGTGSKCDTDGTNCKKAKKAKKANCQKKCDSTKTE